MRYAIYGANRIAKDFMYIFDFVEIGMIFRDFYESYYIDNYECYPIDEMLFHREEFDKLLICDYEKQKKHDYLESKGLIYNIDFIYEEDLFYLLDEEVINVGGREIILWGTGDYASKFLEWNRDYTIAYYVDSFKKGMFNGKEIVKPGDIDEWNKYYIVVAVAKNDNIFEFLKEIGLKEGTDYCVSHQMMNCPSQMLRETIFDKRYYDLECKTMLNHLEVCRSTLHCCCTTFLSYSIGNAKDKSINDSWNSLSHRILCLSAENHTYTFCKKNMCPLFIGHVSGESKLDLKRKYLKMDVHPTNVAIGFDATCNLKCETCRNDIYIAKDKELSVVNELAKKTKEEVLPYCKFLIMAGNGEVFASPSYRELYTGSEAKDIEWIRILSNGTLFTSARWKEFSANKKAKIMLTVSIDAGTKETYEKVRRGGNFDKLKQNMEFAAELRRTGELSYFRLNFVVQKRNYKEMPAFVEWGLSLGVDEIFFTKILNWGTYTDEEFKEVSMMEADGVTPKKELLEVMEHPLLHNPIVDMGTIQFAHEPVKEKEIYNYYRWELERKVGDLFENC